MTREQRLKRIQFAKAEVQKLWTSGIPGLALNKSEINKLNEKFRSWSPHYQRKLLEKGVDAIIADYERLIFSIENSMCEHNGKIRTGKDYQHCCGIYYEYLNYLSCRTALAIILNTIPEQEAYKLKKQIEPLDERFKNVPKRDKWIVKSTSIEKYKKMNYWWYFGLPLTVLE